MCSVPKPGTCGVGCDDDRDEPIHGSRAFCRGQHRQNEQAGFGQRHDESRELCARTVPLIQADDPTRKDNMPLRHLQPRTLHRLTRRLPGIVVTAAFE